MNWTGPVRRTGGWGVFPDRRGVAIPVRTDVDDNSFQMNLPRCSKYERVSLAEDDRPTMPTILAEPPIFKGAARVFDRLSRRFAGGDAFQCSCPGVPTGELEESGAYGDQAMQDFALAVPVPKNSGCAEMV